MDAVRITFIVSLAGTLFAGSLAMVSPAGAGERYVDSDESRDETSNKSCILQDVSGLEATDELNWVWIASDAKLGGTGKIQIDEVPNRSDVTDPEIGAATTKAFKLAFERVGKSIGPGGLRLKSCIYWMERAEMGKAFIPFAGVYAAQAGVGIEAEISDASGKPVARFRVWGRQAADPKQAAFEITDSIANYVRDH